MTPLQALILGLVEGITEYLPISSTGHLIIAQWLLGLDAPESTRDAVRSFAIIVQGGAILAVIGLYRFRVLSMIRGLTGRDPRGRRLFMNLFVAFLPAVVFGLLLDELIENHLFKPVPVLIALALGGVLLLLIGPWQRRRLADQRTREGRTDATDVPDGAVTIDTLTWRQALLIGLLQCVALCPGTSRSMMSIIGGMLVGLRPREAAEFSFLLGLPTLGGACLYKLAKALDARGLGFIDDLGGWIPVLVGIGAATFSAALAVRWLVGYLSRHGMSVFGWYRLALAAVLAWLVWGANVAIAP